MCIGVDARPSYEDERLQMTIAAAGTTGTAVMRHIRVCICMAWKKLGLRHVVRALCS